MYIQKIGGHAPPSRFQHKLAMMSWIMTAPSWVWLVCDWYRITTVHSEIATDLLPSVEVSIRKSDLNMRKCFYKSVAPQNVPMTWRYVLA